MKKNILKIILIGLYLIINYSCNNIIADNPYNGHWHILSNSTVDNYYFTLDIEDSLSTINKYDISRNLFDKKRILIQDDKWFILNDMFYKCELILENDTLILKDAFKSYKWVRVNDNFTDRVNDAFSSIYLNIKLDTISLIKPISIEDKYFSVINIGKLKPGFSNEKSYYNDFFIQCKDQICFIEDIEAFLSVEKEKADNDFEKLFVLINADESTPDSLIEEIIENIKKVKCVEEIFFSYLDKEKQSFVYVSVKDRL